MKLYTTNGDDGFTKDFAGNRLLKDDLSIVTSGKIDTLQSALDMAIFLDKDIHKTMLLLVQRKLWQVLGEIASCPGECLNEPVTQKDIIGIEDYIDSLGEPPRAFVRFTNQEAIWFNECRVRTRELETVLVKLFRQGMVRNEVYKYINRLSSLFFMLGFTASKK